LRAARANPIFMMRWCADGPWRLLAAVVGVGLAALILGWVTAVHAQIAPCDPIQSNPVACENSNPGNPPSEWDIGSSSGDPSIQGFATDISVNVGQTVRFKINTNASAYRIDIYRMGYYAGMGARRVATSIQLSASLPQTQPACLTDGATGLIDCGNWAESASWVVPSNATSGIYFALLRRLDTSGASHIFFVVRNDAGNSAVLFQTSDTTWQAYNTYGGNSLYSGRHRPVAPTRSVTTVPSPRATTPSLSFSAPSTPWSVGSKPTATTSATPRVLTASGTVPSS